MSRASLALSASAALVAGLVVSSTASAAFVAPTDWTRPTTSALALTNRTTYSHWDFFTDDDLAAGVQDTSPDIANFNPYGLRSVSTQNGTILGSGNLYNMTQPIDVALTVPNANAGTGVFTRFLLQISTQGNPLISNNDFSKFAINGVPLATYNPTLEQTFTPAGPQGQIVDNIIRFNLPDNAAQYVITYAPIGNGEAGGSVSQRAISIDTAVTTTVPEPTTLAALGGVALLGLGRRRRA